MVHCIPCSRNMGTPGYILALTTSCCLLLCVTAAPLDDPRDVTGQLAVNQTRLVFGSDSDVKVNAHFITHIEVDQHLGGEYLLFSWGSALKSTNNEDIKNVVGSIDTAGYHEGQGSEARFHFISNFLQLSKNIVVIADRHNACLRQVDRTTNITSIYAGQCAQGGYHNGEKHIAQFSTIADILMDERTYEAILVVEEYNHALRSVDIKTFQTTTIIQDEDKLSRTRSATFDNIDKNILYITSKFQVWKLSLKDNSLVVLAGARVKGGFMDGRFDEALLGYWPAEMVQLDDNHLAVADFWNNEMRLLNLVTKTLTSVCRPLLNHTLLGKGAGCELLAPHALYYHNSTLYIGDSGSIHKIPVSSIDMGPVDLRKNVAGPKCTARNITANLSKGEERAKVEIHKDYVLHLEEGEHESLYIENGVPCSVFINVRREKVPVVCPPSISRVASADTKTAVIILVIHGISQRFMLAVGQHPYYIEIEGTTCYFNINVFDADLQRQVQLQADYKYNCDSLANKVTATLINSLAGHNRIYVDELCKGVCTKEKNSQPMVTCKSGILSVNYATNLTYGGDIMKIPQTIQQTLTTRLINKGAMMNLLDTTKLPPIILPERSSNGAYARLVFITRCLNKKKHDSASNTCVL